MNLNQLDVNLGGGSLLQVANRSASQMMSYIIETPERQTVIIDGGNYCEADGKKLYELIKERGGIVHHWIITHAHTDHYGALLWIFENILEFDIKIENFYLNFPPLEWFKTLNTGESYKYVEKFFDQLKLHNVKITPFLKGNKFDFGGVTAEVLNNCDDYLQADNANGTSIIFFIHFPKRSILFLGDLDKAAGNRFLATNDPSVLKCDIVQMAHHGQDGVGKNIYEAIKPKICLYTAPDWLWDNDNGNGKGSGPWLTLETRRWMEELNVQVSCPAAYGDYLLK